MSGIERLRAELAELEGECERRLSSGRYRFGALLVELARDWRQWPRFPLRALKLWRRVRHRRRPPRPGDAPFEAMRERLKGFVDQHASGHAEALLFVFSGTTHIQGVRGNRPIRQALAARQRGIPVVFSYHRRRYDEPVADSGDAGLLQIPVDLTLQLLDELINLECGARQRIFIVSYPLPGIERWIQPFRERGWAVLYDCRDDWQEFRKVNMASWYRPAVERQVVAASQATLCVSRPLCEKIQRWVPEARVELSPNAVDDELLDAVSGWSGPASPPVIGYFGHLSSAWFDWPALIEVARARPDYCFELIGHSAPAGIVLPDNVQLCGQRPWRDLAEAAAGWSAAIIPFRIGPLADGVDPVKVYEYLAFGLPVVSFTMPQIADYPYVSTVTTVSDFCGALDEAVAISPDPVIVERFLAVNTWSVRINEMVSLAKELAP